MSNIQGNFSRLSIADESLSLEDTTPETPQTGGNGLSSSMDDPQSRNLNEDFEDFLPPTGPNVREHIQFDPVKDVYLPIKACARRCKDRRREFRRMVKTFLKGAPDSFTTNEMLKLAKKVDTDVKGAQKMALKCSEELSLVAREDVRNFLSGSLHHMFANHSQEFIVCLRDSLALYGKMIDIHFEELSRDNYLYFKRLMISPKELYADDTI